MSTLTGTTIADQYKGLIRVDGGNGVPKNEVRNLEDGLGEALPIGIQRVDKTDNPNTPATETDGAKIFIGENGGEWKLDNDTIGHDDDIRTSKISLSGYDIDVTGRGTLNIAGADVSISADGVTGEVDISGAIVLSGDGEIDFYESFVPGDSDAYDIGTADSVIQTVYVSNSGLGFRDADVANADLQVNHNNKLTYKSAGLASHVECQDQVMVNSYEELIDSGSGGDIQTGEHSTTLITAPPGAPGGEYLLPSSDSSNRLFGSRKTLCIKEGGANSTTHDLTIGLPGSETFANTKLHYVIDKALRLANTVHVIDLVYVEGGWIATSGTGTYTT